MNIQLLTAAGVSNVFELDKSTILKIGTILLSNKGLLEYWFLAQIGIFFMLMLLIFITIRTWFNALSVGSKEINIAKCDIDYLKTDNLNNQTSEHLDRMKFLSQKHSIRKKKEAH